MAEENDQDQGKNEKAQELAAKALSVASGLVKGLKSKRVKDFITFKIMIVPKILTFLYLLTTLVVIIAGFSANIIVGILLIFLAHIAFEFAMLLFAILDTLREIRNKLK